MAPPQERFSAIMGISALHLPDNFSLAHVDGYDYRVEKGMWVRHKSHKEKILVEVYFDQELQDEVHVYEFVSHLEKPHTYAPSFSQINPKAEENMVGTNDILLRESEDVRAHTVKSTHRIPQNTTSSCNKCFR